AGVWAAIEAVSSALRLDSMMRGCAVGYVGVVVSTGSVSEPVLLPVLPVPSSSPAVPDELEGMVPVHAAAKSSPHERTMAWFRCICARDSSSVRWCLCINYPTLRGNFFQSVFRSAFLDGEIYSLALTRADDYVSEQSSTVKKVSFT